MITRNKPATSTPTNTSLPRVGVTRDSVVQHLRKMLIQFHHDSLSFPTSVSRQMRMYRMSTYELRLSLTTGQCSTTEYGNGDISQTASLHCSHHLQRGIELYLRVSLLLLASSPQSGMKPYLRALLSLGSHLLHEVGWSSRPLRITLIPFTTSPPRRTPCILSTTRDGALRLLRSPTYDGVVPLRIALISSTTWDGASLHALLASSL